MFTANPPTISSVPSISKAHKTTNPKDFLFLPTIFSPIRNQPKPRLLTSPLVKSSLTTTELTTTAPTDFPLPSQTPAHIRVGILSESLSFIQKFRGKTIVVKYGGAAMKSQVLQASVINNLVLLSCVGLRPVFVHGRGPEINSWLGRLGLQPNFLNGLRVTDSSTWKSSKWSLLEKSTNMFV